MQGCQKIKRPQAAGVTAVHEAVHVHQGVSYTLEPSVEDLLGRAAAEPCNVLESALSERDLDGKARHGANRALNLPSFQQELEHRELRIPSASFCSIVTTYQGKTLQISGLGARPYMTAHQRVCSISSQVVWWTSEASGPHRCIFSGSVMALFPILTGALCREAPSRKGSKSEYVLPSGRSSG